MVLAVSHEEFKIIDLKNIVKSNSVIFDTKAFFDRSIVDGRL